MKKVAALVDDETYNKMMRALKKVLPQGASFYGLNKAFVSVAVSYVAEQIETGNKELTELVKQKFEQIRLAKFKNK